MCVCVCVHVYKREETKSGRGVVWFVMAIIFLALKEGCECIQNAATRLISRTWPVWSFSKSKQEEARTTHAALEHRSPWQNRWRHPPSVETHAAYRPFDKLSTRARISREFPLDACPRSALLREPIEILLDLLLAHSRIHGGLFLKRAEWIDDPVKAKPLARHVLEHRLINHESFVWRCKSMIEVVIRDTFDRVQRN